MVFGNGSASGTPYRSAPHLGGVDLAGHRALAVVVDRCDHLRARVMSCIRFQACSTVGLAAPDGSDEAL